MSEKQLEHIRKDLEHVKRDTEQVNKKLDFLTEQVKLLSRGLATMHSDVCRLLAVLGAIRT